jgi:hypothetical protein
MACCHIQSAAMQGLSSPTRVGTGITQRIDKAEGQGERYNVAGTHRTVEIYDE